MDRTRPKKADPVPVILSPPVPILNSLPNLTAFPKLCYKSSGSKIIKATSFSVITLSLLS